jgi:chemotaxis methyl-accepting protein methylase
MGAQSNHTLNDSRPPKTEMQDNSDLSRCIVPSRVLSEEQRERFEVKSNMSRALREIRECGFLWNYTELFRDASITKLPELLRAYSYSRLPIYSFGCSTGHEPYSLHLVLRDHFGADYHLRFPITGCDLDADCIDTARSGRLLIDYDEALSGQNRLPYWAERGLVVEKVSYEKKLVTVPEHRQVRFVRSDFSKELSEVSGPAAIFLQNVLYHLSFDDQFAVMDRLCSLPEGSIVCLGSKTFTDRAAASILRASGAFSRICELKNALMRRGRSISSATGQCGEV